MQIHGLCQNIGTHQANCAYVSFHKTGKRPGAGIYLFRRNETGAETVFVSDLVSFLSFDCDPIPCHQYGTQTTQKVLLEEYSFMQKDTQPNQTCSEGCTFLFLYVTGVFVCIWGVLTRLDYTRLFEVLREWGNPLK